MKLADLFAEANSIEPGKEQEDIASLSEKLDKIIELLGGRDEGGEETEEEEIVEEKEEKTEEE